jgi:predicted translin family RNA/ssDNA-binding protein
MKIFRYDSGHEAGKTMTVAELKAALDKYPDTMPVMATWEGVQAYVDADNFETAFVDKGKREDKEMCLIIDVGQY